MFSSRSEQLANVAAWNVKYSWGIAASELERAEAVVPGLPEDDPSTNRAAVLVPYLGTVHQTFDALWEVVGREGKLATKRDGDLLATPNQLRLTAGREFRPGLVWEVLRLNANLSMPPADCRGADAADAGVLAAAAHFPVWLAGIPRIGIAIPGYELRHADFDDDPWDRVPWLNIGGAFKKKLLLDFLQERPPKPQGITSPVIAATF